jgi:hypothetical protein
VAVALAAFYWPASRMSHSVQPSTDAEPPPHPDDLVSTIPERRTEACAYPVVPAISRQLRQPSRCGGYALPAGAAVGAAIPLAHCNPERYPHRCAARTLLEHTDPLSIFRLSRCAASGRCRFAVYELKIVPGAFSRSIASSWLTISPPYLCRGPSHLAQREVCRWSIAVPQTSDAAR